MVFLAHPGLLDGRRYLLDVPHSSGANGIGSVWAPSAVPIRHALSSYGAAVWSVAFSPVTDLFGEDEHGIC